MDQIIPLYSSWYLQSGVACTPDNGFLYAAGHRIVYIPEIIDQKIPEIKIFQGRKLVKAIDFNPNWLEVKEFVTLNEEHIVTVWNFNDATMIKGHKVHLSKNWKPNSHCAIAYTKDAKILSVDENHFVKYCSQSNTYVIEAHFRKIIRNIVVMLKTSPYDKDVFAVGCKDGLVLLMNLKKMEILHKLRGHDREITSMDWILLPNKPNAPTAPVAVAPAAGTLQEMLDPLNNVDTFDIYSYDHLENEFGTIQEKFTEEEPEEEIPEKEIEQNENFNFIEACQNLMEDIICGIDVKEDEKPEEKDEPGCSSALTQFADLNLNETRNDSMVPVLSPPASPEKDDFLEECRKVKDFIVVSKIGDEIIENSNEDRVYLATASKEKWIWLWDCGSGGSMHRINMSYVGATKYAPKNIFTVVKWVDESTLLSNNPNGDLVQWNIKEQNNR